MDCDLRSLDVTESDIVTLESGNEITSYSSSCRQSALLQDTRAVSGSLIARQSSCTSFSGLSGSSLSSMGNRSHRDEELRYGTGQELTHLSKSYKCSLPIAETVQRNDDPPGVKEKKKLPLYNRHDGRPSRSSHKVDDGSVWNRRLLGIRVGRLVALLIFVLILSAASICAVELLRSSMKDKDASSFDQFLNDDIVVSKIRTRTPIAFGLIDNAPGIAPSEKPSTPKSYPEEEKCPQDDVLVSFPDGPDFYLTCIWLAESASEEQRARLCKKGTLAAEFCRETCSNCDLPVVWPSEECGSDSASATFSFDEDDFANYRNCSSLIVASPQERGRLCQNGGAAFESCRESCRNCQASTEITVTPRVTIAPTIAPVIAQTRTPVQFLSKVPTASPSISPPTRIPMAYHSRDPTSHPKTQSPTESPSSSISSQAPSSGAPSESLFSPSLLSDFLDALPLAFGDGNG